MVNFSRTGKNNSLSGSIDVHLQDCKQYVQLTVTDTGTGIPEDELPKLFERFYRVQNSQGRSHEGTGIGLALVSGLVKLHGGTISVESKFGNKIPLSILKFFSGEGSSFIITIPYGHQHLSSYEHTTDIVASVRHGSLSLSPSWWVHPQEEPDVVQVEKSNPSEKKHRILLGKLLPELFLIK
jgi:hypothetical protein